jgi:ankyrin repeat protein
MDAADLPAMSGLPNWARAAGLFLLTGELLFAGRIVFESTVLTCNNGPQMVGFSLVHRSPVLFLLGLVCFFLTLLWILSAIIVLFRKRGLFSGVDWALLSVALVASSLVFVPYPAWERFDVAICGPGSHAQEFLDDAASHGDIRLVKVLLAEGHIPSLKSGGGVGALSSAVGGGKTEVVTFLLAEGANVNSQSDAFGETPLMVAAYSGNLEMLELLLAHGAEPCATNREGENALRIALRNHRQASADYLKARYHCPAPPPPPPTSCADKSTGACIEVH